MPISFTETIIRLLCIPTNQLQRERVKDSQIKKFTPK